MTKYSCYANRELSWLQFNQRVLEEAQDPNVPLCEQLSFLSIFQSNLDEFYMVRVGSLFDLPPDAKENKTYMTSVEQLRAIFDESRKLLHEKDLVYRTLSQALCTHGVEIVDFHSISAEDASYLEHYFKAEIEPLLSPQIVGKKQPFPFLQNKAIYAVVVLEKKGAKSTGNEKLGIVPCTSSVIPELIPLPGNAGRFILSEELILHFMPRIFSRHLIKSKSLIRIIRSADIDTDSKNMNEDEDFRNAMEKLLRKRNRLQPVKMEYSRLMDPSVIALLCKYLKLDQSQVFHSEAPLKLSFFSKIRDLLRKDRSLFFPRRVPQKAMDFDQHIPAMEQIETRDRLLSFPYESIKPFIRLLREASVSPEVVSIKMTLYRVATNSKVVEALIEAAENGKDVVVLVELRARFDEENNIEWSRRLEDAGCRIIYGLDQMKVHSKLCLITKKKDNEISYITQIGTGNYNETTSEIYTDMSLMTADEDIGQEASQVFNALCMGQTVTETKYLLVAPNCLQNKLLAMMDAEIEKAKAGKPAYIGIKINSLTDKKLMKKLIEASVAGVPVELVIRGISCLIAGVAGETENITIRSIVGRFLEHHRIYIFGCGEDAQIFLSSADFMTRNTIHRVEIGVPVRDPAIRHRILDLFRLMMQDNVKARLQLPDGTYKHVPSTEPLCNAQEVLYEQAYAHAAQQKK
jgi:polyphosphate kinase